ncbi:hypothetical protein BJ684DRAFT_17451 [Piptocephalis cylindrospora]|uniref:Uncharacterized protein n=1 Tax=Piptocephalis cylindrospora TaxID=1907219 RepID=A0A4P9Y0M6_9FUNG|nr:hypothetical protein BJ684DRAFT_17451 [Piptocephalis cylindrospora]|eukprot:RKP12022.1 hypothetical protein BJ684DRAFT_17451 [Piptocephalis cylindrospora]
MHLALLTSLALLLLGGLGHANPGPSIPPKTILFGASIGAHTHAPPMLTIANTLASSPHNHSVHYAAFSDSESLIRSTPITFHRSSTESALTHPHDFQLGGESDGPEGGGKDVTIDDVGHETSVGSGDEGKGSKKVGDVGGMADAEDVRKGAEDDDGKVESGGSIDTGLSNKVTDDGVGPSVTHNLEKGGVAGGIRDERVFPNFTIAEKGAEPSIT